MRTALLDPRYLLALVTAGFAVVTPACGGAVEMSELPLRNDFSDCSDFTMNDDVSTVDCPDGELRVLVSQPERSPMHVVPLRFGRPSDTLAVSAQARAQVTGGAWGVGCLASGTNEPGRGYALLVSREGDVGLLRIDAHPGGEGGRFAQQLEGLAGGKQLERPAVRHVLRITCGRGQAGTVDLRASIDGGTPITATEAQRKAIAPFTAAFTLVLADRSGTDIRFDNLKADVADARQQDDEKEGS